MFRFLLATVLLFVSTSLLAEYSVTSREVVQKDGVYRIDLSEKPAGAGKKGERENFYFYVNQYPVKLGTSQTITLPMNSHSAAIYHNTGTLTLSGSPDFSISNDHCSGANLPNGASCNYDITFTPSSLGEKTVTVSASYSNSFPDGTFGPPTGQPEYNTGMIYIIINSSSFDKPPKCPGVAGGSIIRVGNQSLGEEVPVVGTNLSMFYSSELSQDYNTTTAAFVPKHSFNFEGWTNSLQHSYNAIQRRLFLGNGNVQNKYYIVISGGNHLVPNRDANEVYVFTPTGKHVATRTYLTGATKYTFGYDGNDRLITITDAFSNVTTFTRNVNGKITSITAPYGQVTTFALNPAGLFSSITNPKSETYSFTYKTGTSLLETFQKPGGQTSTFTYDLNGKLTKDLGHGGNFWELIAGVSGAFTKVSKMSRTTSYGQGYDSIGTYARTETDPSGLSTSYGEGLDESNYTYSAIQGSSTAYGNDERFSYIETRPASSARDINSVVATTTFGQTVIYGAGVTPDLFNFSSITKTSTTASNVTTEVFNNSTKVKTTTSPAGAVSYVTLNAKELPISMRIGSDTATTISYDIKGRLSSTIQGTKNQKTYAYNAAGYLQSVTNALSEVTSYAYNLAGRLTSVTLPDLRVIQYAYDLNGNMTGVTPPSRPIHNFTFNAFELPQEYQPPVLSGVSVVNTQYAYNLDRQLTKITRPTGEAATYNYNATTGLLGNIAIPGGTNTYSYFPNSPLVSRIDSASGIRSNYTYYGYSLASEEQRRASDNTLFGKVSRTFDALHRPNNIVFHGGTTTPTVSIPIKYNGDNKPTLIDSFVLNYSYPSGRLSTTTLDKISDSRTYDAYGNLSGYSAHYNPTSGSPQLLYSYTLIRDTLHRITTKTETIGGVTDTYTYTYDNSGRLKTVLKNNVADSSYVYDSNGNRTSGVTAGSSFTATYDAQDRQLTYGATTFAYNANGDRIRRNVAGVGLTTYTWDVLGNLKTYTFPNNSVSNFGHDGRNRHVSKSVGGVNSYRYIYENDYRIIARTNGVGQINQSYQFGTHVNAPDAFFNGSFYRVITDHLGSVRLVVKTTDGTIGQRMDYNVLGRVMNDTAPGFQAYGFAGGIYLQAENLVKFGARMYDAETGRWLSKDPILFQGGDTNLYGYVMQDPVNWIDPTGLKSTVYLYPGAGGFNHIGISVGNQPSIGNYPGGFFYDQIDQGKAPIQSVTLNTTPEQEAAIQRSLNQGQGYGLVTNNCAQTVNQALCDGGAACAPRYSPTTIFPNNYINFLGGK